MIECQLVQLNDIRIAALVFSMAAFTGLTTYRRHTPVVTHMIIDVLTDFLMTIQTQYFLLGAMKAIMTLGTFVIELGMPLDELARANQRLDAGCPARHGYPQCYHGEHDQQCSRYRAHLHPA